MLFEKSVIFCLGMCKTDAIACETLAICLGTEIQKRTPRRNIKKKIYGGVAKRLDERF